MVKVSPSSPIDTNPQVSDHKEHTRTGSEAPIEDDASSPPDQRPQSDFNDTYDPATYHCTGYNTEGYIWFDGQSSAEDRRFVIDLENGSMDT